MTFTLHLAPDLAITCPLLLSPPHVPPVGLGNESEEVGVVPMICFKKAKEKENKRDATNQFTEEAYEKVT